MRFVHSLFSSIGSARRLLMLCSMLVLLPSMARAGEFIILSGGPALRIYEADKRATHDKYWFNFIDSAQLRIHQLRPKLQPGDEITWLVFRPGYADRAVEMKNDPKELTKLNLLDEIMKKANAENVTLMWIDNKDQLINYMNKGKDRSKSPLVGFEFFGHSNKACFLLDYSNNVDGMSTEYLHVVDFGKINKGIFAKNAVCQSWGCHSGELYSPRWKSRFGISMVGVIGKTDYSRVRLGDLPFESTGKNNWTQ
ncbi:MAG: hypothetical protein ACAI35_25605 [Candidatus Methylacidiphilales bacterium]|nr:hypothetical protein [Candidatus Methylacidiphilales bacterium]